MAELRNCSGQFCRACRSFPQPEGDGGCCALSVFDAELARFHATDAPGLVAEEKDISGHAFDRKVLIDPAYGNPGRFLDDVVICRIGDGSPTGDGGQGGVSARPQPVVDAIAVQVGRASAAAGRDPFGKNLHHLCKLAGGQVAIREGFATQFPQVLLGDLSAGDGSDHLLSQDVQRLFGDVDPIQLSGADSPHGCSGLQQLVPGEGKEETLGDGIQAVPGAADSLQQAGNGAGSSDMADEVDVADVDAQFQRGRGHNHRDGAGLQLPFRRQAALLGQTAVVGGDLIFPQALTQLVRDSFRQAAGVDKDQGRPMSSSFGGNTLIDGFPKLQSRNGTKLQVGNGNG